MKTALDSLMRPSVIEFSPGLVLCQFDIMKLVPAYALVRKALETGALKPNGLVIESSSGTFGLALAIVCKHFDVNLSLVTGPLSPSVRWRLENLDVAIQILEKPTGEEGGIQADRKKVLLDLLDKNPDSFWPQQHTNPDNPLSYSGEVADTIFDASGPIDVLVCSVGTGGSISGLGSALRQKNTDAKIVAVDHNSSILFGPTTGQVNRLCTDAYNAVLGMGADVVASNLRHSLVDQVHWVPMSNMVQAVHRLHREAGVLIGPTGGATYLVGSHIKSITPKARVLCITPDHGFRYADTVFNVDWLAEYSQEIQSASLAPIEIERPQDVTSEWVYMDWHRQSYKDALGHDPISRGASVAASSAD